LQLCADLDVDTAPIAAAEGLVVAPLLSWYDAAFDADDPRRAGRTRGAPPAARAWAEGCRCASTRVQHYALCLEAVSALVHVHLSYSRVLPHPPRTIPRPGRLRFDKFCRWPVAEDAVWQVMLRLNTPHLAPPPQPAATLAAAGGGGGGAAAGGAACGPAAAAHASPAGFGAGTLVITASHFLPHPALPSSPYVPELRKAVGCAALLSQVAAVGSSCHVYGHTHINRSEVLEDPCPWPWQQQQRQQRDGGPPAPATRRRYVQYALEAAFCGPEPRGPAGLPGLACVYDGTRLTEGLVLADIASGRLPPSNGV
jgi:hypothetical protein